MKDQEELMKEDGKALISNGELAHFVFLLPHTH